ncbi:MAG: proline dehydrogenase family protein [Actinobacteria bacterium]|nr:proline dehydrogenase family protein [Actinomycetota bacterium]
MPNRVLLAASRSKRLESLIVSTKFTRSVADRFVAGETLEQALAAARTLRSRGMESILDYLGENVRDTDEADLAAAHYLRSLFAISSGEMDCHISVKLTQVGLDISFEDSLDRMKQICAKAQDMGTIVAIDMESREYTDRTIETYRRLRANFDNVVLCLQAYLKRTAGDVRDLLPMKPAIRICKGAYDEPSDVAFDRSATNESFKEIMSVLLETCPYTAIATHDQSLIDEAKRLSRNRQIPPSRFEFQMLYGVRRELQRKLILQGHRLRIYLPFGNQWYPYLMRRLAERPANLKFFLEAVLRG